MALPIPTKADEPRIDPTQGYAEPRLPDWVHLTSHVHNTPT